MQKLITTMSLVLFTSCVMQTTIQAAPVESAAAQVKEATPVESAAVQVKEATPEVKAVWLTDFEKAKALSKESGKPIFALFTGSDWCGWCIKLHKEVLAQSEFVKYAGDSLILFEADFPRTKQLSAQEQKQNQELSEKYGVRGFPSVLILDSEGAKLAATGYKAGGPKVYVDHVKALLKAGK